MLLTLCTINHKSWTNSKINTNHKIETKKRRRKNSPQPGFELRSPGTESQCANKLHWPPELALRPTIYINNSIILVNSIILTKAKTRTMKPRAFDIKKLFYFSYKSDNLSDLDGQICLDCLRIWLIRFVKTILQLWSLHCNRKIIINFNFKILRKHKSFLEDTKINKCYRCHGKYEQDL